MNALRPVLSGIVLAGGLCATGWVQNAPAQNPQSPSNQDPAKPFRSATTTQPSAPQADASSDQPVSLAEAARLARANKPATEKAAKKYDDDNFPRSTPLMKRKPRESGAVDASVKDLPGEEMKRKLVLLDFWASWCGPCRAGVPNVQRLNNVYSGEDFMVISVSEDEDEATWRNYVCSHQMTWTQRFDAEDSLSHKFQVGALPTYILLDRDGNEIQRWVGEDPGRSILERIGPEIKRRLQASE
jgi:thiol-disulfide isomerase/thioredoxin